jgi:DHA1 family bicyclomycin/chloramphenicol resistance-like MFS transporter
MVEPAAGTARATPGAIALLTSMVMLGQMSISLYIPSLPSMGVALAAPADQVKLTMTFYLAAFAVAQLVWGPMSDRFGRRPVLFAGIAVYLAGTLACALAPGIGALIAGRALQGIGACVGATVSRAVTRDRYDRAEAARTMAFIGMAMAAGPAIAPVIGGQLQHLFGWRSAFMALLLFGTIVGVATWRFLAESNRHPNPNALDPQHLYGAFGALVRSRVYVGYSLVGAGAFAGLMAYTTGIPFVFIDLFGVSPAMFGFVPAFTVVGYFSGSVVASRLAGRVAPSTAVAAGTSVCAAAGTGFVAVVLAGAASPATVVAPMVVFMFGFGVALPHAMASSMQPFARIAGAASALQGFLQMTIAALGTLSVAALADGTPFSTALGVMMGGVLAAVGYFLVARPALRAPALPV